MYKGSISLRHADALRLGFIGLFTMGGLTGLFLASLATDVHLNGTYFVVAHFHYIMVGGAVMAYLGGIHFWWPKITGRMYPEGWAQAVGAAGFRRLQPDVLPAIRAGLPGHAAPLRAIRPNSRCSTYVFRGRFHPGVGYLLPLVYLIWSLRYGPHRRTNPWGARVSNGRRLRRRPPKI